MNTPSAVEGFNVSDGILPRSSEVGDLRIIKWKGIRGLKVGKFGCTS